MGQNQRTEVFAYRLGGPETGSGPPTDVGLRPTPDGGGPKNGRAKRPNPPDPAGRGYRTAYLWEEALERDSLLDLLARFLHLQVEEKRAEDGTKVRRETMIFPRYHQLRAVRAMVDSALANGVGTNYLIEHSAGSGKSNTIAWLAHRLSSLHNAQNERIFDSVIVVTDRVVLDQQLQDTIYQFDHKMGVVQKIDDDSRQLAEALRNSVPLIITTLQKFPFVSKQLEKMAEDEGTGGEGLLPSRRCAVLIDEAHSSQSGETATKLKAVLGGEELVRKAKEAAAADGAEEMDALYRSMAERSHQTNLSFFASPATPKHKTLKVFGRNGEPFHRYTMRQAIEEGYHGAGLKVIILDAFYRFMPPGFSENDNGQMASVYNELDRIADRLKCCFVLIHHTSKGEQHGRAVTDVGAGAGSQSRATDTHLILRRHREQGAVVLEATVRSWPPLDPVCLRWRHPVWETDRRNRALIVTMYRSGTRLAETLALRPCDVDAERGAIRVLRGKGGRARTVGIDPWGLAVLSEWMDEHRAMGFPAGGPLFCTRTGRPIAQAMMRRRLPELARAAGIHKRVHAHGLRHTHAVELRAEGVDVAVIRQQLGHQSLLTTVRYLDHLEPRSVLELFSLRNAHG